MTEWQWIIVAVFLPLFPLSIVFNALFQSLRHAGLRALLLLVWPLAGLAVLQSIQPDIPQAVTWWALFTAGLYAFRAVVVREASIWCGFLASSAWALSWVALANGAGQTVLLIQVLAFSAPLVLLQFLIAAIERRYGSAFAGVVAGLAQSCPRLAGLFTLTLLAAIGTPLFPAFFAMLANIIDAVHTPAVALAVLLVWLLWSWSGMQLLQGLLIGAPNTNAPPRDMSPVATLLSGVLLAALAGVGLLVTEVLL